MYRRNYRYEKIEGATRNLHERIPEEAFREAVANALVLRLWDSPANVQISMNDRGVKIVSPGGLPSDLSYDEYVEDRISVLRNPIIANVFLRLNYIEAFGMGVARIRAAYEGSAAKPKFSVTENTICVELPVVTEEVALTDDEIKSSLFRGSLYRSFFRSAQARCLSAGVFIMPSKSWKMMAVRPRRRLSASRVTGVR